MPAFFVIMFPCIYYYYFGIECPGCGFQRSLVHLFHGDFYFSLLLFPGLIPLLLFLLYQFLILFFVDLKRILIIKKLTDSFGILALTTQLVIYALKWMELYPWANIFF